jgi:UDP-N-acetylglucosamine acyltransferase
LKTLIHPTAVIHTEAELHASVQVGPYAVIGPDVRIGADTVIGPHVVIEGPTEIGARNRIYSGAVIGTDTQDKKFTGGKSWVRIGNGNTIREYVTINRATGEGEVTEIGDNNLLLAYVHVAHNCIIEDSVTISNAATLAGHVYVESQATISGVLGIHQFVHVGRLAMVGGMSRIDRDVPPFMLVEGNPARVRALNRVGIKRAGFEEEGEELATLKRAYRVLYRSGFTLTDALGQLAELPSSELLEHLRQFLTLAQKPERRGLISGLRQSGE